MKSTMPAGTIEVSAHIQIAIDKERKGSPTITNLKPPLALVQTKKRDSTTQSAVQLAPSGTSGEMRLELLHKNVFALQLFSMEAFIFD